MSTHVLLPLAALVSAPFPVQAVGNWTPLRTPPPYPAYGSQILLSDGTVFFKTAHGGDNYGNQWIKLIPDNRGHYVNGTWSTAVPPMADTRIDFSSQLLKDGRVYVAGGEYGTGRSRAEVYDPSANAWTSLPWNGGEILDANLEILDDGRILQSAAGSGVATWLFDPANNAYTRGPNLANGRYGESVWVKLPDNSILMVNSGSTSSERYIPEQNRWVADGRVPVSLYDPYGTETGPAFLLPNGKAIFFGSQGPTAIYTPSGNASPGTWKAGAPIPNGYGQPDAIGFMLADGKILIAVSSPPTSDQHFPRPMYYYEYDYRTDSYTQANAPAGGLSANNATFVTQGVDLPDGTILYTQQASSRVYVYTPEGPQVEAGKPLPEKIVTQTPCKSYMLTGSLFNGISEGASYGDDVQMNTNYPIVRLSDSIGNVRYARTRYWNSTGVQQFGKKDTVYFTLPAGLPEAQYDLSVSANGIISDPIRFNSSCATAIERASAGAAKGASGFSAIALGKHLHLRFHWEPERERGRMRLRVAKADGRFLSEESLPNFGDQDLSIRLPAGGGGYLIELTDGGLAFSRRIVVP